MIEFLLLVFISKILGRNGFLRLKLAINENLDLNVNGSRLKHLRMLEKDDRFIIMVGNRYLNGSDRLKITMDEELWEISNEALGKKFLNNGKCLTYNRKELIMDKCYDMSDFRSALQLFTYDFISESDDDPGIPKHELSFTSRLNDYIDTSLGASKKFFYEVSDESENLFREN